MPIDTHWKLCTCTFCKNAKSHPNITKQRIIEQCDQKLSNLCWLAAQSSNHYVYAPTNIPMRPVFSIVLPYYFTIKCLCRCTCVCVCVRCMYTYISIHFGSKHFAIVNRIKIKQRSQINQIKCDIFYKCVHTIIIQSRTYSVYKELCSTDCVLLIPVSKIWAVVPVFIILLWYRAYVYGHVCIDAIANYFIKIANC